jgi:hypothetical protein
MAACGDTNLFEGISSDSNDRSRLEEGLAALDDGNWDEAISIFGTLDPDDPEVQKYLSSAYMGRAGFDVLSVIELVAEFQEENSGDSILYDTVTSLFGGSDGTVSSQDLLGTRSDIGAALDVLGFPPATDELLFQAGLYAALDMVAIAGGVLNQDDVTTDGVGAIPQTEIADAVDTGYTPDLADDLVRDAVLVTGAVASTGQNDVVDDLDQFLLEVGYSGEGDGISAGELTNYLAQF